MRYALCNETYSPPEGQRVVEPWKFEDQCRFSKKLGYHALELAPFTFNKDVRKISAAERASIKASAGAAGIEIIGLHWVVAFTEGFHITSPDAAVREKTARYAEELINFCADVGGKLMVWGSPKQRSLAAGISYEQGLKWASEFYKSIMPRCEARNICIHIEPLTRADTNFINSGAQGRELVKAVNHPNFGLHLDVRSMCDEGKPIPDIIRECRAELRHFHVNDPNMRGPGNSGFDHKPIAAALKEIGYQGYVSVEVFKYDPDPETIAREAIEYIKRIYV